MSARDRRRGLWAAAATLAVVTGLAAALSHLGSPGERRLRRIDDDRIGDLQALRTAIVESAERTGRLPESLDPIEGTNRYQTTKRRDPVSGEPYAYEVMAPDRFRLCAEFDRPTDPRRSTDRESTWEHPRGRHCFTFTVNLEAPTEPRIDT
jgi:hypothetical protein